MWQLTDEQVELRDQVRDVVMEQIRPRVLRGARVLRLPGDLFEVLAARGCWGSRSRRSTAGRDELEVSCCAYVEELARFSGTVSLMAAYVSLVAMPILIAGSEEQKKQWLPSLVSGERYGSYALTEPDVGSDPAALQTRAERHGDTWVLNGREALHRQRRPGADLRRVRAHRRRGRPRGSARSSSTATRPASQREPLRTMGMPGWQLGAPKFEDVEVPHENLLGGEGDGFKIAMKTFDRSRPVVAAQAVGRRRRARSTSRVDYAMRRHTFGEPLLEHQGIQFKLAGMEADVAAARALTLQAARAVDDDDPRRPSSRRWRSWSPATPRCASPTRPCRSSAATATSRTSRPSG